MKTIYKMIPTVALLMAVAASSCKKYLDYTAPGRLSIEQTFESVEYTNAQIIGVYTKLAGSNAYGNQLSIYFSLGGEDFTYRGSSSFDPARDYAIANYGTNATNTSMTNAYNQLYEGVERANVACKYIPASSLYSKGAAGERARLRCLYGEALALRAQFLYELVRNWGDVPASFIPAADLATQFTTHANRDSTLEHLLADLKLAGELVPWRDSITDYGSFRFTRGAVKALRARIALARGGYSLRTDTRMMERRSDYQKFYRIAFEECNDIIKAGKHGLNPVFENIFKTLHQPTVRMDNANELMMEVAMWGQVNDSNLGSTNGLTFSSSPSWGGAGGTIKAVPTYFYEFANGTDSRRDATIALFKVVADDATKSKNMKIAETAITCTPAKFRKSWTVFGANVTGTYGVNWPLIRYADVLLMYAEAANELQELSGVITPLEALQQVQRRAYGSNPLPASPGDKEGFFNTIVKERLLEFGGEGLRKYDLIRWNLVAAKIEETRKKLELFAVGAPVADNPYKDCPEYLYAAQSAFNNLSGIEETATLNLYGGPVNTVLFTPNTVTSAPSSHPTRLYWRREAGLYTNGVLASDYIYNANTGFACKFEANKKELLPYPYNAIVENRGNLKQNFGYDNP